MLAKAAQMMRMARLKLAEYIRARKEDVALIENCTAATTSVLRAVDIRQGDTIICLSTAYGMVKKCIQHYAEGVGAEVVMVDVEFFGRATDPCGPDGNSLETTLAQLMDAAAARGSRIPLVTFDYIASCPGVIMPVVTLANRCKVRGIPCLLDGAHALGQIKLNCHALEAAGITYFMADAHKWLFSPKGSAFLWVTRRLQGAVHPPAVGAVCSNSPSTSFDPAAVHGLSDFEHRFQYTGTRDYTPLIAVHDALLFRAKIGERAILRYNHDLAIWAQEWLASLWGTEILVPRACTAFMAHIRLPVTSAAAARLLQNVLEVDKSIHVIAFTLPARLDSGETQQTHWIRPCMQLFICREDVSALGDAVLKLAPKCERVASFGATWLFKARHSSRKRREAGMLAMDIGHRVTVGFSLTSETVSCLQENSAQELNNYGSRGRKTSPAPCAVAAVAKYSAGNLGGSLPISFGVGFVCGSSLSPTTMECKKNNAVSQVGKIGSPQRKGPDEDVGRSPLSVIDIMSSSMASSGGASIDGSCFSHPTWLSHKRDQVRPCTLHEEDDSGRINCC